MLIFSLPIGCYLNYICTKNTYESMFLILKVMLKMCSLKLESSFSISYSYYVAKQAVTFYIGFRHKKTRDNFYIKRYSIVLHKQERSVLTQQVTVIKIQLQDR